MFSLLFSKEQIGDPWMAIAVGLMGFVLSFGIARAEIIPSAGSREPVQIVAQALPPSPPPIQRAAPGCPA